MKKISIILFLSLCLYANNITYNINIDKGTINYLNNKNTQLKTHYLYGKIKHNLYLLYNASSGYYIFTLKKNGKIDKIYEPYSNASQVVKANRLTNDVLKVIKNSIKYKDYKYYYFNFKNDKYIFSEPINITNNFDITVYNFDYDKFNLWLNNLNSNYKLNNLPNSLIFELYGDNIDDVIFDMINGDYKTYKNTQIQYLINFIKLINNENINPMENYLTDLNKLLTMRQAYSKTVDKKSIKSFNLFLTKYDNIEFSDSLMIEDIRKLKKQYLKNNKNKQNNSVSTKYKKILNSSDIDMVEKFIEKYEDNPEYTKYIHKLEKHLEKLYKDSK